MNTHTWDVDNARDVDAARLAFRIFQGRRMTVYYEGRDEEMLIFDTTAGGMVAKPIPTALERITGDDEWDK